MKKCSRCQQWLEEAAFYRNRAMSDGLSNNCKPCQNEAVRAWRESHRDKSRELSREGKRRQREREGDELTRAKWRDWYHRDAVRQRAKQNAERVPEQEYAHYIVSQAVKHGVLTRPDHCEQCGKACKVHGHHRDYAEPLRVTWLCPRCHRLEQG